MGKHGPCSEGVPFGDADDLKGFKELSGNLAPEVRDLALALRGLFKATGMSLRTFAARAHFGPSTVCRYLSGERISEKHFLDSLMEFACEAHGQDVTSEVLGHIYQLHREALLAIQPARYREQMASDRLEEVVLQKEQAELQIHELRGELLSQRSQLQQREEWIRQVQATGTRERHGLGAELVLHGRQEDDLVDEREQLRETIEALETALDEAVRERDAAQSRCAELEAELAVAQDLAEREELRRQAEQERLRLVKAAGVADQRLADLERVQREAERIRLAAARDAAARLEEAQAKAREIIEEATVKVTRIRPSVVGRSAALRLLRDRAVDIAEQRMPTLIDQLSHTDFSQVDTRVVPIPITTTDEIGEVARAFDQVHREAVRLAAEQVLLRSNSKAIVTNLSHRTKSLIAHQLTLITHLERGETDAHQLENLNRLGNLAIRLRRNTENLLTLTRVEPGHRTGRPVAVSDVLRAACSEVEEHERIQLYGLSEAEVDGRVATDLVHLLAELLENATRFSSAQTMVRVIATCLPDGLVRFEIHDKGIGLTAEDFADINDKLSGPPTVGVEIPQRMGLYIVGRLSGRHGILVYLRPSDDQVGTTALVTLPVWAVAGGVP